MSTLKELIVHPGAEFIDEEICLVKSFLPQDVLDKLLSIVTAADPTDWDQYIQAQSGQWASNVLKFEDKVGETLSSLVEAMFKDQPYKLSCNLIRRSRVGQGLLEHYDGQHETTCKYGVVVYLNDDYTGGEIYYPNRQKEYKPIQNSVVIHSADKEYTHGVRTVKEGTRYFVTFFIHRT
jgi:hypothetical protein